MANAPFTISDINEMFIRIVKLHTPKVNIPKTDGESIVVVSEHNPKTGKKLPEFPSRRVVGELIFGSMPREHVVDFYLSAVANFPRFEQAYPNFRNWSLKNEWSILHIFVQSFFTWVLDNRQKRRRHQRPKVDVTASETTKTTDKNASLRLTSENSASVVDELHGAPMDFCDAIIDESLVTAADESLLFNASMCASKNDDGETAAGVVSSAGVDGNESKAVKLPAENKPPVKTPVKFSAPQTNLVVRQLIGMRFPPLVRIWSTVLDGLSLAGPERIDEFVAIVQEMIGAVSFGTLNYCLSTPLIAKNFRDPTLVVYTLLLGPLKGTVVESFAASRDMAFRASVKKLLLEAECCARNQLQFVAAVRKYARNNPNVMPFSNFTSNTFQLMRELRHDEPLDNNIPWGWAHSAIKRAAKRYYIDKTWQLEHINDLFLTVIAQRPSMKQSIVQLLQNVYKDEEYAGRIRRLKYHSKFEVIKIATYAELHFELPGHMSLPFDVNVFIVDNVRKLEVLEADLIMCENSNFPVVGLDSEWSSYVAHSKASVLQISFEKSVYLVDLDALKRQKCIRNFIERLFCNKKILKIGFQFHEDLIQLRECARDCKALYEPENLICIGKLIGAMLCKSAKLGFDSAPYFTPVEQEESQVNDGDDVGMNQKKKDGDEENGAANREDEVFVEQLELELSDLNVSMAMEAMPKTANGSVGDENSNSKGITDPKKEALPTAIGYAESIRRMGLSSLCQHVFQKCLDKTEQCSVWDRRPLRPGQVRYAALDAYVIIELYKHCQKWAADIGVDVMMVQQEQEKLRHNMPLFF